ncbi:MAG: hypothetical protein IT432_09975 [Phycisphaerales bacterium]|nr:hypothetical protein [Phycisphaerales bacterium]
MKKYLTVILGGLMTFGVASAQVVTPPTPAPAKTPDYVPPPQPAAQPPAQPAPKPGNTQYKGPAKKIAIPKVDYKPIFEKGPDGKVLPISDSAQRLTLLEVHNPFMKDTDRAKVAEYLSKRDHRMETVAVDNLDLTEKVESGEIDRLDFVSPDTQRMAFTNARAMTEPISPFGDLISDMSRRDLLNDVQGAMCDKLWKEYQNALREENRPASGKRVDATWMGRFIYNDKAAEALVALNRARVLAVTKAADVLPKSGLDSALASTLTEGCKKAPADAKGRVDLFKSLTKDLPIEQRRAWLKAALATRPEPQGEPLIPFPKNTGRRQPAEDPNADPNAEPPPAEPAPEPTEPAQNK